MPQRLPPLLALRAFEAAGRLLSFTLAADELHLTQGAISRQVRQLEDFLRQKLFVRLTRRIELTEAGKDYLESIQLALGVVEDATRRCLRDTHRVLTLDVLPTLASYWLMPRLARFTEAHPDIEVRLVSSIEPANLQNKEIDIAIRVGRLPGKRYSPANPRIDLVMTDRWRGLEAYPLLEDALVPVMSEELAARLGPINAPQDLLNFKLINNITRKNAWHDWLQYHGVTAPPRAGSIDYGHFFMTLQAAREGKGIALIPSVIFDSLENKDGLLCPLKSRVPSAGEYYMLMRETAQPDPAVLAMREWLIEEAQTSASVAPPSAEAHVQPRLSEPSTLEQYV
ncbi:LysR family transcriptional regulator, glycine cleavage system transcriptional activator [Paraburkholderia unamae]|uniref:LysR substrate-binding domain-containing protein n=1 Tax=Paraburkholderia unamae TaxID=219649 RepID=UPI001CB04530|nr:LysR substrate-binding domain-containing protein [Paraburkholderia unamae]CAG9243254.1 LysR family transcriptional regulator, glycine cleavage system transcriptional activator [Paraburkholderia unamae]